MAWEQTSGEIVRTVRPSASTTRSPRCGFMSLPPLATAAATIAICSGVTRSRSCPMPTRPRSTAPLVTDSGLPLERNSPEAAIWLRG